MKVQKRTINIERSGVVETKSFTIKASGKAFRILSDGLYSDKILAILRELSSNAYDAHAEAGTKDRPFLVHLPNSLEPWFNIRDYGTGMPHDDVMNLYSTYFDSSKTDSNDATGMLGLGSKSPFSYTESFTVTSYINGEKRTYIVDIGEEGVPQISLAGGFPISTDEHNGLEIQFAVKSEDFRDFENKAEQVYKRYSPLPEVVGVPDFKLEPVKYLFEGDDWRLIDSNEGNHYAKCYVIQGTVAYPVNLASMRNIDPSSYDMLFGLNLEMDFPIGELDVAANRETLSYDERTITNLVARADKAKKEIGEQLSIKFKECKSLWEARMMWSKVFGNSGGYGYGNHLSRLVNNLKLEIKWRGKDISPKVRIEMDENLSMDAFNVENARSHNGNRVKMRRYAKDLSNNYLNIAASDKIVFFVDDLEKGAVARVRFFVNEMEDSKAEVYMIRNKTKGALKDLVALLGGAPIRNVSELPKPTRKGSSNIPGQPRGNGYVFKMPLAGRDGAGRNFWTNTPVDLKAGGYYLPVNRARVFVGDNAFEGKLQVVMHIAKELGVFDHETTALYGIPKSAIVKLNDNWVNVFDHITTEVKKLIDEDEMAEAVAKSNAYSEFHNTARHSYRVEETVTALAKLVTDKNGLISKLAGLLEENNIDSDSHDTMKSIASQLNIEINLDASAQPVKLADTLEKIYSAYPMLAWPMDSYTAPRGQALQSLVDYVNMVDQTAKKVLDSE